MCRSPYYWRKGETVAGTGNKFVGRKLRKLWISRNIFQTEYRQHSENAATARTRDMLHFRGAIHSWLISCSHPLLLNEECNDKTINHWSSAFLRRKWTVANLFCNILTWRLDVAAEGDALPRHPRHVPDAVPVNISASGLGADAVAQEEQEDGEKKHHDCGS